MVSEGKKKRKKRREININQMEIDDIPSVYHLGEKLFTSEEAPILYRTWDPYEVTGHYTSDPEYCLVAQSDGVVVGFILATTIEKEGTAWKKYGYLSWIAVDENFQRAHVATRLYRKLEDKLLHAGVRMIIADTDRDNREALGFFTAINFSLRAEHIWLSKTLRRPPRKPGRKEIEEAAAPGRAEEREQVARTGS
ncbi:MAG: GNAT family N-acetyltransferase [Dehalococcoidia bacterium]|nr:GNAT family N-acetyltransferase [Dehalococcoidia bacterium]